MSGEYAKYEIQNGTIIAPKRARKSSMDDAWLCPEDLDDLICCSDDGSSNGDDSDMRSRHSRRSTGSGSTTKFRISKLTGCLKSTFAFEPITAGVVQIGHFCERRAQRRFDRRHVQKQASSSLAATCGYFV